MRTGVCGTAALVAALLFVGASPATTCPAAAAYAKKAATARATYFKTHTRPAQRAAFVKKQQAKLAALRAQCNAQTAPAPEPPPAPAPAPPTPSVNLTMGADMPGPQGDAIKQGIEIAKQYFAKLGVPATWHADVYAEATFDAIVADYVKVTGSDFARSQCPNSCAFVGNLTKVFIYPFGSNYYRPDELVGHVKTPVHELWHTVQYTLAGQRMNSTGADGLFLDGPNWLREGSAEFVGYSALVNAGVDASFLLNNWHYGATNRAAGVSLESTAPGQGNSAAYDLGFYAVQLLVKDTGTMHSLIDYWTKIGQGVAWPTAFQQTFGRTPEQFYAEFAQYRTTL